MLGGAWPGSRSSPGAQAEARDRPRSASRAGGERLEVPWGGVGQRPKRLGCLVRRVPRPGEEGVLIGGEGGWRHVHLYFLKGPTGETVQA